MGVRLRGETAVVWQQAAPFSEPTTIGAIQMTPSGEVLVLMADRQTLGGYPKLGHLSWWGRCLLAQAKPFSRIQWTVTDLKTAKQLQTRWYQFWQQLISN
jgi:allophanate hydrolase subunit 2